MVLWSVLGTDECGLSVRLCAHPLFLRRCNPSQAHSVIQGWLVNSVNGDPITQSLLCCSLREHSCAASCLSERAQYITYSVLP